MTAMDEILKMKKSLASYEAKLSDKEYDKTGIGFNLDERFRVLTIVLGLDCWAGRYGSSGCSTALSFFGERFKEAFVQYINSNCLDILKTVIGIMEKNCGQEIDKEIDAVQKRLEELKKFKEGMEHG